MVARPPRRSLVPTWVAVAVFTSTACGFDPSAPGASDDQADPDDGDGGDGGDGGDDAPAACPEELHTVLTVAGRDAATAAEPVATVLLGDTVVLSAAGSCSQRGPVSYQWQIDDADLLATADASLDSESVKVYPERPDDFQVTLTVSDDAGSGEPVSVAAIRALGWTTVSDQDNVRDVAAGAGRVWIAAADGGLVLDLADPGAGVSLINDAVPGQPDLSDNLGAVHFAPESNLVWFAREGSVPQVWRVEAASLEVLVRPLPQSSDVRDFDSLGSGVIAGSDDGVFGSPDNLTFSAPDPDQEVFAVAQNADGGWAGDRALLEVDTGESFFPFADNDDNKIRALAGDGDRVWVGSDNQGIALFNGAIGEQVFTEAEGLPSNKVRGLAIDAAGDVWAATDRGVARFKSDRQKWIAMGAEAGLDPMLQNAVGIAVLEEGGQRHVVIGASGGIAILGP